MSKPSQKVTHLQAQRHTETNVKNKQTKQNKQAARHQTEESNNKVEESENQKVPFDVH